MRYIDSGSRDPQHALGTWLSSELVEGVAPTALRMQTGFFSSHVLGYFENALRSLASSDGHTRFLVGSNDGQTPYSAMAHLLAVTGAPRAGMKLGVVSYQTGFFHPKVVHITRADGSSTAYVGSANLTGSGVTSLHVEAGLIVDSKFDSPAVLDSIADAIDQWFTSSRAGMYLVSDPADLQPLVQAGVLDVKPPRSKRRISPPGQGKAGTKPAGASLSTLISVPPVQTPPPSASGSTGPAADSPPVTITPLPPGQPPSAPTPGVATAQWAKKLSKSDAGRKPGPNANSRGSIPLGKGSLVNQSKGLNQVDFFMTFLRNQLFSPLVWTQSANNSNHNPINTTEVPMHTTVDRKYYGLKTLKISYDPDRMQGSRAVPIGQIHTEPIADILKAIDVTDMNLEITLDVSGDYWFTIT
ncbi:phospholipase D-like domain-containing protein [Gordonia sp. ABSL11-1]|uniref:phospholipase D-like domain-containing protein n=1 Tax=Gordonia sp. ABSL11-1 TaxID=3053924 RepID=UPI0025742EA7|nr:phospholipase D-like domain-containing protein [Gordonia sp. ABSL11-1]MDL9948380.1 phospholipase D-like domain-containing protein [Gordonia sp. ABSL11-1]